MYEKELKSCLKRMKERCNNPKRHNYQNYGGKGIIVCSEWNKFDNFYKWAIENGYEKGLSIERIDTDGNYCPENCKWIPLNQQGKNRSTSIQIEYNGKTQCFSDWCKELGLKRTTIQNRMYRGLSFEEAINMIPRKSLK